MLSQEIRRKFIEFFKNKGHAHIPSSPVVPHDDPSLLFINAGMNQFKDVFLGKSTRDYSKAVTAQKCIRVGGKHNDLDNVGHTSRHMTFFEMLGNFSFGAYFKQEAIAFAFEVTTEIFEFPIEKLWISIFETDDESFEIWKKYVKEERIVRMGEKENFWQMGDIGPCGPCSELLLDRGPEYGPAKNPLEDLSGERYLEFWNLVFMESNRQKDGHLSPLPKKSIDTGSGLERVVSLKMGVESVFETDVIMALIRKTEEIFQIPYKKEDKHLAPAFHVIADHIRALAFAISDGAAPSNVERGYVLRKILRRAMRYGKNLGMDKPFLAYLVPTLIELMGEDYPELKISKTRIEEILTTEEENFLRTLQKGGNILHSIIKKAQQSPHKQISGEDAFKLKDTYGFPIEEVLLIAKDMELEVNLESYQLLEEKAKEKSRKTAGFQTEALQENLFADFAQKARPSHFLGYEEDMCEASVVGILVNGEFVEKMQAGEEGILILDQTPFYAEKGGQVGDKGIISHEKMSFSVTDTKEPYSGIIAHFGKLEKGIILKGDPVWAEIDQKRRRAIEKSHTATHLLDYALMEVLGGHARQAGSLVEAERLRFDFTHHKALTEEEIRSVENIVNDKVRADVKVSTYMLPYEEARKRNDIIQEFGEKYGKEVRVVDTGGFSKELCGGTHVQHTGVIGLFRIAKESSIGAGTRRIEAFLGKEAESFMYRKEDLLKNVSQKLDSSPEKLLERIDSLQDEMAHLKGQIKKLQEGHLKNLVGNLMAKVEKINDKACVLAACVDIEKEQFIPLSNELLQKLNSGALLLAQEKESRCQLLIRVTQDLIARNVHANQLMKEIAPIVDGKGGGSKDLAQAGGKNPDKIVDAFEAFKKRIKELC